MLVAKNWEGHVRELLQKTKIKCVSCTRRFWGTGDGSYILKMTMQILSFIIIIIIIC